MTNNDEMRSGRVLHIVESLDRGAVENWLVRMLEYSKRCGNQLDWTFYCCLDRIGEKEGAALAANAKIVRSTVQIDRPISFVRQLRAEIKRGQYGVLHCHHDLVSALYLFAAIGTPIRTRIVHVHNADENVLTSHPLRKSLYKMIFRAICFLFADKIVGISEHTLNTFIRGRARRPNRDLVHYYGVEPDPSVFAAGDVVQLRRDLAVPLNSKIVIFGGRLVPEKNPVFAVDILKEILSVRQDVFLVFAGAGAEEENILARAAELSITSHVRLLGWRSDLPKLMSAADLFILPRPEHPMEGFGLAVVEAQLAGLPMLLSKGIAGDPILPRAKYRSISLRAAPSVWAAAAVDLLIGDRPSKCEAVADLYDSPMQMTGALRGLCELHKPLQ